jgi:hypothetical protein
MPPPITSNHQTARDILQVVSTARARNKLLVVEADGTVRLGTFKDKVVHWLKNRNMDERSRAKQLDNPDWRVADALADRMRDEFGPVIDDASIRRWQLFKAEVEAITGEVPWGKDETWRLPVEQLVAYLDAFVSGDQDAFQERADQRYAAKQERIVTQTLREVDGNPDLHQSDFELIAAKALPGKSSRKFDAEQRVVSTISVLERHIDSLRQRSPTDEEAQQAIARYEAANQRLNQHLEDARAVNRLEREGLPDSDTQAAAEPQKSKKRVRFASEEESIPGPEGAEAVALQASRKEMPRKVQSAPWNVPLQLRPSASAMGTRSTIEHTVEDFETYQLSQRPSGRRSAQEGQDFTQGEWANLPTERGQPGATSLLKPGGVNSAVVRLHERSVSNAALDIYKPYLKALNAIGAIRPTQRLLVQTPHDYSAASRLAQLFRRAGRTCGRAGRGP